MKTENDGTVPCLAPKRILLVDDHPLVREGLARVLAREPGLVVCGEAADRKGALQEIALTHPDLATIDLTLKDSYGLDLIKDARLEFPRLLMLVVSMHDELMNAERVLRAGASGYVTKEQAATDLVEAVRRVLRGELHFSPAVLARLACRFRAHPRAGAAPALDGLTDREMQVLDLIGRGLGRRQIAGHLHLDVNTIETYRARIKEKLGIKDALELLQYAIRSSRAAMEAHQDI